MSSKPIELTIKTDADTDEVEDLGRGLDDVADAAEKVEKAIDDIDPKGIKDVAKETDRAADDVEDDAKRMEKAFDKALDDIDNSSKNLRNVGDNAKRGFKDAGDATETFKDEAKQNLSETVSSFRGDAEDLAQIVQDVFGGVVSDLGPLGAAAGTAVAAGIGIGVAALQAQAEEAEVAKQKMLDLADMIREADGDIRALDWGSIVREWGNEYDDVKSWFEPWQKASVTNFEAMEEAADKFGLSYTSLVQGMAGNTDEGRKAIEELNGAIEEQQRVVDNLNESGVAYNSAQGQANSAERQRLKDLKDLKGELETATGLTEEAIDHEQRMAEAIEGTAAGIAAKNEELAETIDLNRGVIDSELDWMDTLDGATEKLAENAANGWDKNTAAGRENLRTLGEISDGALEYADSIAAAGGSQAEANAVIDQGRQRVIEAGIQLGMTKAQAEAYATSLGLIPKTVDTTAKAETKTAEQDLQNVARDRQASVIVKTVVDDVQAAINRATAGVEGRYVLRPDVQGVPNYWRRPG